MLWLDCDRPTCFPPACTRTHDDPKPFQELDSWLESYRRLWDQRMDRLEMSCRNCRKRRRTMTASNSTASEKIGRQLAVKGQLLRPKILGAAGLP
jgi:hypothetical protein